MPITRYKQVISGSVTANQGTPAPVASAWPIKVTDGTNVAAVKTASTPPAATDPALVVSISPNSTLTATNPSVGLNAAAIPTSSTQIGGSDGLNLEPVRVFDGDSGAGNEWLLGANLRASGAGGSVEAGTASDPLRVDPTGTTTQPVSGTVTSNQGTPAVLANAWPVEVTDGVNVMPTMDVAARAGFQHVTDGTNTAAVKAASMPAAATDPALVVAISPNNTVPISGTVTADQGTPAALANKWPVQVTDGTNVMPTMDVAARAGFEKITDGTNTAAVKAASTAPAATDPALVVTLSPNSSLPTGINTTATGTLAALNDVVTVAVAGQQSVGFQLSAGTLIGTIIPELSFDGGTTFNAAFFDDVNSALTTSIVFAAANTAQARTISMMGGATHARVRVSVFTSGTANLTIGASQSVDATVVAAPTDGFKRTYSANVLGLVPPATPTDIFTITGIAGTVVRVIRITITGTRTAAGASDMQVVKRRTANAGGTSAGVTAVPTDSLFPAAGATVLSYTANPAALGTLVGAVASSKMLIGTAGAGPATPLVFEFGKKMGVSGILRSASEVLAVNMNAVSVAGNNFDIFVEWCEEPA